MALKPLAEFDVDPEIMTREAEVGDMSPSFTELYEYALEFVDELEKHNSDDIGKRDTLEDTLTEILTNVKNSHVVEDILLEISGSKQQIDNLSRGIYSALVNLMTGGSPLGLLNISIDTSTLLDTVMSSGIIPSVADDLLLNDKNRENLTYHVGDLLTQRPYIAETINNIGHGQDLTFDMIFNTARHFESKAPQLQDNRTTFLKRADNDYLGTFGTFVSNIISSATQGEFFNETLSSVLGAVKRSGIVTPIVLTAVQRPVMNMVGRILSNLYDYGVFDGIPLNDYFQTAKKNHLLADGTQDLLTSPKYSPPVAKLFKQLEDQGTLENVRRSLYG